MSFVFIRPAPEALALAAKDALAMPDNASFADERLYETHAPVIGWAPGSDDLRARSNYEQILQYLSDVAGERDQDVLEISARHWAAGRVREVFVRVQDEHGHFTTAWVHAVAIALYLQDHRVFDEQHLDDLQRTEWQVAVKDEMPWAASDWEDDVHHEMLVTLAIGDLELAWAEVGFDQIPDHLALKTAYRHARDTFYTDLGRDYLTAQIPGQGALL